MIDIIIIFACLYMGYRVFREFDNSDNDNNFFY